MVVSTTQRIFEQTINDGIRRGKIPEMSRDSREWFRNKAKAMGKISENKLMKSDESRLVDKPEVGSMYMYIYDPKTKDKLPYYDKFPLIFPIGFAKEGFYGINFHYIPIQLRAKLMAENYTNNDIVVDASKPRYFGVNNFRSEINKRGVVSPNKFLVTMAPFTSNVASNLNAYMRDNQKAITLRCDSAILPAINVMTSKPHMRFGYGPTEEYAHGVSFDQLSCSYIIDKRARMSRFFYDWLSLVVNYQSKGGADMENYTAYAAADKTGQVKRVDAIYDPYEVGYKDDYSNSKMSVYVYDDSLNTVMEYKIYDVFPKLITGMPLSWEMRDSFIKLNVTYSFTDYEVTTSTRKEFNNLIDLAKEVF